MTSFLGAEALKDPGSKSGSLDRSLQLPEIVAVVAFVGLAVTVLAILWPRKFKFRISPARVLQQNVEGGAKWDADKLQRNLALWIEIHVDENQPKLDSMLWWFRAGSVLLVIEVVAWLVDLT